MKGPFPVVFSESPQGGDRPPSRGFPQQQLGDMLSLSLCHESSIRDLFRFPAAIMLTAWYKKRKKRKTARLSLGIMTLPYGTSLSRRWIVLKEKQHAFSKLYDDMCVLLYYRTRTLSMMTSPSMATALTTSAIILKDMVNIHKSIHCLLCILYSVRRIYNVYRWLNVPILLPLTSTS